MGQSFRSVRGFLGRCLEWRITEIKSRISTWSQQHWISHAPAVRLHGQEPKGWKTWLGITVAFSKDEKGEKWWVNLKRCLFLSISFSTEQLKPPYTRKTCGHTLCWKHLKVAMNQIPFVFPVRFPEVVLEYISAWINSRAITFAPWHAETCKLWSKHRASTQQSVAFEIHSCRCLVKDTVTLETFWNTKYDS